MFGEQTLKEVREALRKAGFSTSVSPLPPMSEGPAKSQEEIEAALTASLLELESFVAAGEAARKNGHPANGVHGPAEKSPAADAV